MEYAINKMTGRLVSAEKAPWSGPYECPVCQARVSRRSGAKRAPHFAHLPGWGSPDCENFVPGQSQRNGLEHGVAHLPRERMELRLRIPTGADRTGWSIELVLPPCRECRATMSLDVGGRIQTIDMRGMQSRRCVTAELSVSPYRIVSFGGKPEHSFVVGVDRECAGLPTLGAAAFTASGRGELKGFPRTQELRASETFALLWREPAEPGFPDELVVERLRGREGWSLALVTVPDDPSPECCDWLGSFTGLPLALPRPSIFPVWPFLTRNSSVNRVECVTSSVVLLSAKMMPLGHSEQGPTLQVQGGAVKRSVVGMERSPALFALKPGDASIVRVSELTSPNIEEFISFSLHTERHLRPPTVDLVFITAEGVRHIVSLHQRRCVEVASVARAQRMQLEYLSMPPGAMGTLCVDGPAGRKIIPLSSGSTLSPYNRHMRLPPPEVLQTLITVLADPSCHVDVDFVGLGRMQLSGSWRCASTDSALRPLTPALRSRLLSFIFQLGLVVPASAPDDDVTLVEAIAAASPAPPLIPHYRSLVKELLACGFKLKRLGEGASL